MVQRHFTASAFVAHQDRVLLLLHSTKGLWLPPGGHVEPDEAPAAAAVREVYEETGLRVVITSPVRPHGVPEGAPRPEASLEIEVEPGHVHLDLAYFAALAAGEDAAAIRPNEEAHALHWWSRQELASGRPDGRAGLPPGTLPPAVAALAQAALDAAAG